MNTGNKAKSSLRDITHNILYEFLDTLPKIKPDSWFVVKKNYSKIPLKNPGKQQTILIDSSGFNAEGTDPERSLSALLAACYSNGWRNFIIYRVNGQRLISTAVMGKGNTDDVQMEVYGTPGEYFGAYMQGGNLILHGNAQNFAAMCMHHGNIKILGNAGKVCGYASKGGEVFILGDIIDRAWTNSVNDPRCQELKIHVFGSASKYAGESLMGGNFFFGGLYFDFQGQLTIQDRPYRGTKLLGGASRGNMLFFDPNNRLEPSQFTHGRLEKIEEQDWSRWEKMVVDTLNLAGVKIVEDSNIKCFYADEKKYKIIPDQFKLIKPKGGLKGYESH
jgi:hypothetical protein